MEQITRGIFDKVGRRIQYKKFNVFSKEDVDVSQYPYWHDAVAGIKVRTDDDYVVDCLKVKSFVNSDGKPMKEVWLSIGRFVTGIHKVYWEKKREVGGFSRTGYSNIKMDDKKNRKYIAYAKLAARMILETGKIDHDELSQRLNLVSRIVSRKEGVKELIQEEIDKILKEQGIDGKEIIDMYLEGYRVAKTNMDSGNMIRVAENFAKMKGMFAKESKQITSVEYSVSSDIINTMRELEEAEKKLLEKPKQLEEIENAEL